jgi:hypothetical protein
VRAQRREARKRGRELPVPVGQEMDEFVRSRDDGRGNEAPVEDLIGLVGRLCARRSMC